eukprot:2386997-Prymnesium_polylepis.2
MCDAATADLRERGFRLRPGRRGERGAQCCRRVACLSCVFAESLSASGLSLPVRPPLARQRSQVSPVPLVRREAQADVVVENVRGMDVDAFFLEPGSDVGAVNVRSELPSESSYLALRTDSVGTCRL